MNNRPWFDARSPAEAGVRFVQSLLAPLFRPAAPVGVLPPRPSPRFADSSSGASWTASLHRGDGLPPFLLRIDMAAGERFAMRFEPFSNRTSVESRGG